ncbi:glycosyltransferase family 4 protein [Ramlibacter sp. PS4R-6]|uniref:glycosyltransferase family 4 protein n=1 Tax=Ramlibacter sp. PS4R-6 TaxID=3133438 RepID=UPI0030B2EC4E
MRVVFNATALRVPLAGVGQYTLRLAQALQALRTVDLDFFDGRDFSRELHVDASARRARVYARARAAVPAAYAIRRWLLQRRFDAGRAGHDLYHEPATVALRFDGPTVLTVHDLSWIRHPETHPAARVRELERVFAPGLARAARVITGSASVKAEIAREFSYPADRIDVIPHGIDPVFRPRTAEETRAVLDRHGLRHGGYFLCVGTLEPRKNLRLALQGHASLPAALRAKFPLVVAGMAGWGDAVVPASQAQLLGYVEREELAGLTAGALALVYPSRYEGFGLPPLEAMACGVPPITGNASSLPEVVGDAGLMVDPDDAAAMTRAMASLAGDAQLRETLGRSALDRARKFTWQASAQATVQSYRLALGRAA